MFMQRKDDTASKDFDTASSSPFGKEEECVKVQVDAVDLYIVYMLLCMFDLVKESCTFEYRLEIK